MQSIHCDYMDRDVYHHNTIVMHVPSSHYPHDREREDGQQTNDERATISYPRNIFFYSYSPFTCLLPNERGKPLTTHHKDQKYLKLYIP